MQEYDIIRKDDGTLGLRKYISKYNIYVDMYFPTVQTVESDKALTELKDTIRKTYLSSTTA